jgi:hypothetical protein
MMPLIAAILCTLNVNMSQLSQLEIFNQRNNLPLKDIVFAVIQYTAEPPD